MFLYLYVYLIIEIFLFSYKKNSKIIVKTNEVDELCDGFGGGDY